MEGRRSLSYTHTLSAEGGNLNLSACLDSLFFIAVDFIGAMRERERRREREVAKTEKEMSTPNRSGCAETKFRTAEVNTGRIKEWVRVS